MIKDMIYDKNNLKIDKHLNNDISIDFKIGDKVLYLANFKKNVIDYYTISSFNYNSDFLNIVITNDRDNSTSEVRYISRCNDYLAYAIVNSSILRKCVYEYKDVKLKTKIVFDDIDLNVYDISKDHYYEIVGIITDYDNDVILLLNTLDSIYYSDFINKCKILKNKGDYNKATIKRDFLKILPINKTLYI